MEVSANLKKAIEDYINGDTTAFTTIYNESHKYIYVCVNNVMSGNDNKEDLIQDIMQDTYVEISKHINSLQNVNQFLSWAGTIATRKCYEYIKKMGKYTLLNEDESFDTLADDDNIIPEEIMQNKEKQRLIREIIQNELSDMQKLCVVGYFYNEMKQSEIAKELDIPENSVKSHLLRAKAKIKESVLDLEKKKGTKLYAVTPLLLLLFTDEVKACVVSPAIGESVLSSVGVAGAVTGTSAGTTAATVGATAAKTAVAAVKIKAIVIAAASAVTIGGVGAGVGIAVHNKKQDVDNEPTKVVESTVEVTTEEVTTEEVTTEEMDTEEVIIEETTTDKSTMEGSIWDDATFAKIGEIYQVPIYGVNYDSATGGQGVSFTEGMIYTDVYNISVTKDEITIELSDIEDYQFNYEFDFDHWDTYVYCQLLDKKTGECIKKVICDTSETTIILDMSNDADLANINFDEYYLYITYYDDELWYDTGFSGLLYEIPKEEPDDGLKSTLVEAAKKAVEDYGYTDAMAFSDYNGDGVPEFLALTGSAFGNLYGTMYKYENNEYVYYMDVNSFGDSCSRLYRDTTDGSYVVLEMDYEYEANVDENFDVIDYYSYNEVYFVDVDTQESYIFKTIEGDDMLFIEERTFYNDDGTTMTAEEFFALLDSEMLPQYEYVGDLGYGYEYYNENNTELIAAYNYYLDNLK